MDTTRPYRTGDSVEDLCRACKTLRGHKVVAADGRGAILRVVCGYCGSDHRYRGGEAASRRGSGAPRSEDPASRRPQGPPSHAARASQQPVARSVREPFPLVSERERRYSMKLEGEESEPMDLEMMLRRVLREELGLGPAVMADRWQGGDLVLRPGRAGLQEKSWPIETFFNKIVMIRNRLRVLEQQVNGADIPQDLKIRLQGYVTGCYGTLTSFNVLFSEEEDRFKGSGSGED